MQSLTTFLSAIFGDAFAACGYDRSYGDVVLSNRPDLGDFQCNGALPAAREYKQNPRQIAQQVVDALSSRAPFAAVGLAGPGFINIRLSDPFLAQHTGRMAADARRGVPAVAESQTIILDYGGPNAAKYMHVGHLRSSIIGDSIRRIFRFAGDEVIGDIHMGDWGLQMGMLITEIERHDPTLPYFDPDFEGPYPAESPVTMDDLQVMYPAVTARCREEPIAKEAARQATMELQSGRPGYFALWQHIHDISVNAIHEDVDQLGVSFNLWLGESDVRDRIEPLVNNLLADGIALESRGATIVDVSRPDDSQESGPVFEG